MMDLLRGIGGRSAPVCRLRFACPCGCGGELALLIVQTSTSVPLGYLALSERTGAPLGGVFDRIPTPAAIIYALEAPDA